MDFIRKNISTKLFFTLMALLAVFSAGYYFAAPLIPQPIMEYSIYIYLFVFFLASFITILIQIKWPLNLVFTQMKALLTGHTYKKIITNRIDEIGVLAHFFNEVTKNIEKISVDVAEGRRLSKEVSIASDIQRKILPKELPQVPGLITFGNTRPASEVGGDSFDIMSIGNNTFSYVGDVTGHGLPAALIMVMVNTIIRTLSENYTSGYDIIVNTNRILKQRIEPRRFMTCVLLRWNHQEQKMYFTGAGHEHILIYHKAEKTCEAKQTGGIALGMVPDVSHIVKEEQIPLSTGDIIVLYSDGITEAKNIQNEMFGLGRLKAAIERYAESSTPEELFTHVSRDFGAFVGEQTQEDDISLLLFQKV